MGLSQTTDGVSSSREPISPWWYVLGLALLATAAYWRALGTEFIGDDVGRILVMEGFLRQGYLESITSILPDRPLLVATIYFNHLLGGVDPWGYKALSLLFHIGVGLVFFAFLLVTQKRFSTKSSPLAPAITAAIFLVHPLNTQALLSSIQRGVLMATLGGLAALLFFIEYLSSSRRTHLLLSLLCYTLGILSKPVIVILPCIMIVYLVVVHGKVRPHLLKLVPFFAISLLPAIPHSLFGFNRQDSADVLRWYSYLSVQTRVLWMYLKLFVVPTNLRFFYEINPDPSPFRNFTWLAIIGHGLVLGAGFALARRRKLAAFGIFAMYLAFLPESGIFPINHTAFEHRTYFPMLFFLFSLFALLPSSPGATKKYAACALPVLAVFSGLTYVRIGEVSTHEKWALNTYSYRTPSRPNNLVLLMDLFGDGGNSRGRETVRTMIAGDPGFPLYPLFDRLYTFGTDRPETRKQTMDAVTDALMEREKWQLDDVSTIHFLLAFLAQNSAQFANNPIAQRITLERVFRNQLLFFFAYPDMFRYTAEMHRKNLDQLRGYFEEKLQNGALADEDFITYLNILGQQGLFDPQGRDALRAAEDRREKANPARAGLVEGSRDYYRKLKALIEANLKLKQHAG